MKKILFALLLPVIFSACKKDGSFVNEPLPAGTVLATGNFVSNMHPTSGIAKIILDSSGNKRLSLQNFKTDSGPDLRVWLSSNINGTGYAEAGVLTATTGNFSYALPGGLDFHDKKIVLIWCEDFSVLFGHAVLQ